MYPRAVLPFLIAVFFFFAAPLAHAATYYVDATGGSDSNDGTATTTAWQTLTKVKATTFSAGDFVLFKKGETFAGNMVVGQSGTSGNPITFGAYGEGPRPIIDATGNTIGFNISTSKSYIAITGLEVRNATTNQFLFLSSISYVTVTDCVAYGGGASAYMFQTGNFTDITISSSTASGYAGASSVAGVRLGTATSFTNITVDGVTATSSTGTNGFIGSSATTTNVNILNSHFSGHTSHGISFSTGTTTGITIRDTTTTDNGGHGIQFGGGYKSSITIDGVDALGNTASGINFSGTTNARLVDLTITDTTANENGVRGIAIAYSNTGATTDNVTISTTTASDNATGEGVYISSTATDVTVTNVTALRNGIHGLLIEATGSGTSGNVHIVGGTFNENTEDGVKFGNTGTASGALIEGTVSNDNLYDGFGVHGQWQNVVFDDVTAISNGIDGTGPDGDGFSYHDTSSGIIRNSIARDNKKSAVAQVHTASTTIYNNVFSHETNGTLALVSLLDGSTHSVYNNTIYSAGQAGTGMSVAGTSTVTALNNIVYGFDIGIEKGASATLTEDYNLAYNQSTNAWSGFTPGTNSFSANPVFADAESNNFRLTGSSAALNEGTTHPYVAEDILGNPIFGSARDLGAYEYQAAPNVVEEESGPSTHHNGQKAGPSRIVTLTAVLEDLVLEHRDLLTSAQARGVVLPEFVIRILGLTSLPSFVRDLTLGSEGNDVRVLQERLISKGFSIPAGATGYFGTQTQTALAQYQAVNGIIPAAGYFGPLTRAVFN